MKRQSYRGLYIDTETGGLDPELHALTSICVAEFTLFPDAEPEMGTINLRIIPADGWHVTPRALEVQGLTHAEIYHDTTRITESAAVEKLARWLVGGEGLWEPLPIWAHNAGFDRGFVSALANRRDLPKGHLVRQLAGRDSRWSCTRYLAEYLIQKGKLEMPRKPDGTGSVSLDPLMERLGISGRQGEGHDAHEDVRLGVEVLDRLLRLDGWWD